MAAPMKPSAICSLSEFLEQPEYDYVIVGGGAAGLVLATRLSEDPTIQVAVLEAGDARLGDPNIGSPVGMAKVLNNPDYDWCFRSTPQARNSNKVHHVARGKCLGGSSCINFLAYCRPSKDDIDRWEELGHTGWTLSELEPYYKKSERITQGSPPSQGSQDIFAYDPQCHGDGPIATSFPTWKFPFEDRLLRALDETSGTVRPTDPCSGNHLGFYGTLSTIDRTERPFRCDAATGYMRLMENRSNVKILPNALACRVILEGEGPGHVMARGVVFSHQEHMYRVLAKRETIISCGSLKTPQLLELSGIGDPAVLQASGLFCHVNLPAVGNGLQEHPLTAIIYELAEGNQTLDSLFADPNLLAHYVQQYLTTGQGPVGGCMSLTGFLPYASLVPKSILEDTLAKIPLVTGQATIIAELINSMQSASIQFTGVPANFSPSSGYSDLSKAMPGAPLGHGPCYTILVSNAYPLSRGSCHIVTSDPFSAPCIDLGLLSHPADVDVLAAGARFADQCFQSVHVSDQIARRICPPASLDMQNLEQLRTYVQDQVLIFNHLLGTCAMGAVVDERLKVKNVQGLRIIDASVIPSQLSGNIIATVHALAERGADLIKHDASKSVKHL